MLKGFNMIAECSH